MAWLNSLDTWLAFLAVFSAVYFLLWKDRLEPMLRHLLPSRPVESARSPAETEPKTDEIISDEISGIETPDIDAEMISISTILKLVSHQLVTETDAMRAVFGVRPGGSKEYKRLAAKLKAAKNQSSDASQ